MERTALGIASRSRRNERTLCWHKNPICEVHNSIVKRHGCAIRLLQWLRRLRLPLEALLSSFVEQYSGEIRLQSSWSIDP